MNMQAPIWIKPERLFDGENLRSDMAVKLSNGRVSELALAMSVKDATPVNGLLCPGFIDLQVNGGCDILFNTSPTVEGIKAIRAAHLKFGTIGILPTVITDAPEVTNAAVDAVLTAWGQPGIIGIHIEGPHLSVARRGTHGERFVRPVDGATIAMVTRLRDAKVPVMITVAPEATGEGDIAKLAATGAVVSLGHTDTDAADVWRALDEGARSFTHLYNAMSPMLNRAPGVVGAAINSRAYTGIICDGVHVADEMIALAIRARPEPDLCFLISDAMPTVGGKVKKFSLYGQDVTLQGGKLINQEGGLAGAHLTMAEAVERLINIVGIDAETALRMATTIPARVMRLEAHIGVLNRRVEDLILLSDTYAFEGFLATHMAG